MISIYGERLGDKCRLYAKGHANEGKDRDAVCAGVSALTLALLLHAKSTPQCTRLRWQVAPGEIFITCKGLGDAFETVMGGLKAIAAGYPGQVKIETAG